ncbi:SDR family oxidoreductase [Rhodopirellula sp.]|nr:SDR family oxidoreductase [Rhodopirellula sp.]MDB4393718.1 SDR family oxidoreductase [Rhodopirellula sp.]MDB4474938.1 SDR family oxidoreductase [bacterium]MDB4477284.1 SDR family oxidoreductase [Rhodopirellula sp.]
MSPKRPAGNVKFDNHARVVIVTGGSMGIGAAITHAFAESDAYVYVADLTQPERTNSSNVETVKYLHCDTSSEADCEAMVKQVIAERGGVDVLINNAAIQPRESYHPIDRVAPEVWRRMIDVNLCGYMQMASQVLPQMKRQQSGVIVNIASGQAHRTAREVGVYGPIKSANVMQARQWGVEYARDGIRVLSISPGAIDTPMIRASLAEQGGAAALGNRHPIGRIGKPHEVASAVLWLTSAAASFVTATDLEVDGGLGALGSFADPYPMPK